MMVNRLSPLWLVEVIGSTRNESLGIVFDGVFLSFFLFESERYR